MNTPLQELGEIEAAVRKEFGAKKPTKPQVIKFLRTSCFPKMDGGLSLAILFALKYAGVASLILSGYNTARKEFGGKPPKCPVINCPARQVTIAPNGMSVCSNGHRWRPK
jgi:hypothetical protein